MEDRRRWETPRRQMKPLPRNIFKNIQEDKENDSRRADLIRMKRERDSRRRIREKNNKRNNKEKGDKPYSTS